MTEKKLSSNEIKQKNRQMIYRYIRKNDSVSKQDIVLGLQLSLPTVTQNLQYLVMNNLIDTSQKIKNTGGRNATAYTYMKQAKMAIGVYLTTNHIGAVAVDLSGNVVKMVKERVRFNLDDDGYLKKLGQAVEQVKEDAGLLDENLLGVGIAVPGLVSEDGERVTYGLTLNFTGKTREQIAKYIPYRNRLFHDSSVAGYAEVWIDPDVHNAFYIGLNNSIGGSIIIDREIYEGNNHRGGEIGHVLAVPEGGKRCYCGRYGCLDTVCQAGNLDCYTEGDLGEFFRLLREGDATAKKLWDRYLEYLAAAINDIRMLFDSVIIIGGYVGAYIGEYMDDLYRRVDARNSYGDRAQNYLIPCKYKVEVAAAGAALFYIDDFIDHI